MTDERLKQLATLSDLIRDRALEDLRRAAAERDMTKAHLAGLAVLPATGLSPLAAARAAQAYQQWADERRRQLNIQLARQTVTVMQRQADARQAFGRAEVLHRLAASGRR